MKKNNEAALDAYTRDMFDNLYTRGDDAEPSAGDIAGAKELLDKARSHELTQPIVDLFEHLLEMKKSRGLGPDALQLDRDALMELCEKHERIDEHGVTVGGRVARARKIAKDANARIQEYLQFKDSLAPSGLDLWDNILENQARIKSILGMGEEEWNSFSGQLRNAIGDVETLSKCLDLPAQAVADVLRVTRDYRMRLTPYYASLIQPGRSNDPVLLQSVPTAEMVDNVGEEIPPVAADHSPARLIDQFYPRVVTIKATNICAMYCTHCLRIAHIGKKDQIFSRDAYSEALDYIRRNDTIRDVLITGGDAFMLPNKYIRWLLEELDSMGHVRMKRLGTRVPVTTPMRVDAELLDILEASNDKNPVRVVTQINTAQEITPVSREAFKQISKRVSAVLNQAVLLRGINDHYVKMWKLCETIQEAYVRPYYVFNCSYRNPQFSHMRVPVEKGRDIVESMYGNISGDAIPRYIATAGGKIPLHRSNVVRQDGTRITLRKPWSGEEVDYPDPDSEAYEDDSQFAFNKYWK